jgi:3-oxoacyl-[acyl-carrier protein] reductase
VGWNRVLAAMTWRRFEAMLGSGDDPSDSFPAERRRPMQATERLPVYPDLAGKVAVVTGGSGGIGAVTCRLLAANGTRVAVNGRDPARIQAVVDAIHAAGGQAVGVAADCTDPAGVERLRQRVEQDLGPAEVVAAFVGGGRARPGPVTEVTEEDWRSTVDGSLTATFLTLKSFLPGMLQRGRGVILTMASSAARLPGLGAPAPYVAAKAGVIMLSRQVASEVGRHGVRVNCLAPHTILTEQIQQRAPAEWRQQMAAAIPLGRLGTPEDVALAAVFLASDNAAWLTGVTLDVAGGYVMT